MKLVLTLMILGLICAPAVVPLFGYAQANDQVTGLKDITNLVPQGRNPNSKAPQHDSKHEYLPHTNTGHRISPSATQKNRSTKTGSDPGRASLNEMDLFSDTNP